MTVAARTRIVECQRSVEGENSRFRKFMNAVSYKINQFIRVRQSSEVRVRESPKPIEVFEFSSCTLALRRQDRCLQQSRILRDIRSSTGLKSEIGSVALFESQH